MGLLDLISIIPSAFRTVDNITNAISNERIAALNATTDRERIAAEERAKMLTARRDVLIAEAGVSRANIVVRTFFAVPVIFVLWKLFIWDKALCDYTGGHTDPLSPELWHVIMIVIGFYFLYEGAIGVTRIIKR